MFDIRRFYYFKIKNSMFIILKCYYEIIYLEILKFLVILQIFLIYKFASCCIYLSFCIFVDKQFVFRLANSINSKLCILLSI